MWQSILDLQKIFLDLSKQGRIQPAKQVCFLIINLLKQKKVQASLPEDMSALNWEELIERIQILQPLTIQEKETLEQLLLLIGQLENSGRISKSDAHARRDQLAIVLVNLSVTTAYQADDPEVSFDTLAKFLEPRWQIFKKAEDDLGTLLESWIYYRDNKLSYPSDSVQSAIESVTQRLIIDLIQPYWLAWFRNESKNRTLSEAISLWSGLRKSWKQQLMWPALLIKYKEHMQKTPETNNIIQWLDLLQDGKAKIQSLMVMRGAVYCAEFSSLSLSECQQLSEVVLASLAVLPSGNDFEIKLPFFNFWNDVYEPLCEMRCNAQMLFYEEHLVKSRQSFISDGRNSTLQTIWDYVARKLVGSDWVGMVWLGLDSEGRMEISPYSGLAGALLLEARLADVPFLAQELKVTYHTVLWLIRFFIAMLGETPRELMGKAPAADLTIDNGLSIFQSEKFVEEQINTPDGLMERWFDNDVMSKPALLHQRMTQVWNLGIVASRGVIKTSCDRLQECLREFSVLTMPHNYYNEIFQTTDLPKLTRREAYFSATWHNFKEWPESENYSTNRKIKRETLFRPLQILATCLSMYYGLSERNPLKIFQDIQTQAWLKLNHVPIFPVRFIRLCESAYQMITYYQDSELKWTDELRQIVALVHDPLHEVLEQHLRQLIHEKCWQLPSQNDFHFSPLLYSAARGRLFLVQTEAENGIKDRGEKGKSALLYAAEYGHLSIVQWLLGKSGGAAINETDADGKSALFYAATEGHLDVVSWLLLRGGSSITELGQTSFPLKFIWNDERQRAIKSVQLWTALYLRLQKEPNVSSLQTCDELDAILEYPSLVYLNALTITLLIRLGAKTLLRSKKLSLRDQEVARFDTDECQTLLEKCFVLGELLSVATLLKKLKEYSQTTTFSSFKISHVINDLNQVDCLNSLFGEITVRELIFINCEFSSLSWSKFLAALARAKTSLVTLTMMNCSLEGDQVFELAKNLCLFDKLASVTLDGNNITFQIARQLMRQFSRMPTLAYLSLRNCYIEQVDKLTFEDEFPSSLDDATALKCIDLSENYIISNSRKDKVPYVILQLMLRKMQITPAQLCQIKKINIGSKQGSLYPLSYDLDGSAKQVAINDLEMDKLRMYKTEKGYRNFDELFSSIQSGLSDACIYYPQEVQKAIDSQSVGQKEHCKKLLHYYKDVPLKYHLLRHPIFYTGQVAESESLILPKLKMTHDRWCVHFLAAKETQHALLAYEGLSGCGQRLIYVAHLTATKEGKIIIENIAMPVEKLVSHVRSKYNLATFLGDRSHVKALRKKIEEEIVKGVPSKYSKAIFLSSNRDPNNEAKFVQNCTTWAVDNINAHLGLSLPISFGGIPSETVKILRLHPDAVKDVDGIDNSSAGNDHAQCHLSNQ